MATSTTDRSLDNNAQYASGKATHKSAYPGKQPIQPAKRLAVVACMDARLDVEDLLGLQTGEAHIIRNAGGVVSDDAIRSIREGWRPWRLRRQVPATSSRPSLCAAACRLPA